MKNSAFARAEVLDALTGLAEEDDRPVRRMTSKRIGEVSEAALALKARTMGFMVAKPWGGQRTLRPGAGVGGAAVAGAIEVHAGDPSVHGRTRCSRFIASTAKARGRIARVRLTRWWSTFRRAMPGTCFGWRILWGRSACGSIRTLSARRRDGNGIGRRGICCGA